MIFDTPRRATTGELVELASVLAAAFDQDALLRTILRPEPEAAAGAATSADHGSLAARRFFEVILGQVCLPHGETWCIEGRPVQGSWSATLLGVVAWLPPGTPPPGLPAQLALAPRLLDVIGLIRAPRVLRRLAYGQKFVPEEPHWHLFLLGVLPSAQGRGAGSMLLQPVLERCDEDRQPAYVQTANPRAVPFLRRHGFEPRGEFDLPGGPHLYGMYRVPRR